jgi:hypothetical protein
MGGCTTRPIATVLAARIESVAPPPGERSPSGARSLSAFERSELAATARGLPPSWVVVYNEYTGQLSLTPRVHLGPLEAYSWWERGRSIGRLQRHTSFRPQ